MGEIAEAMLDGTLCGTCGEYLGEDLGYPGYCSKDCDPNYEPPARNHKNDLIGVKKESQLAKLQAWLYGRQFDRVKTGKRDRIGQPMIGLSLKVSRGNYEKRGLIICANDALAAKALALVDKLIMRGAD